MKNLICHICNKQITLNTYGKHYKAYHNDIDRSIYRDMLLGIKPKKCDNQQCHNITNFRGSLGNYSAYCSLICRNTDKNLIEKQSIKLKETLLKRDNAQQETINQKRKHTNILKYGHISPLYDQEVKKRHSDAIKAALNALPPGKMVIAHKKQGKALSKSRIAETSEQKNGRIKAFNATCFLKYGSDNPMNSPDVKYKNIQSNHKFRELKQSNGYRFCNDYKDQIIDLYVNQNLMIKEIAKTIPFSASLIARKLFEWGIEIKHHYCSVAQLEILQFLTDTGIEALSNNRSIIDGRELDIYLPYYNLAIEYNGLYYHSELNGKDRSYHLNKMIACKNKNIQLIHIFEDEWINKRDIVKSRLLNLINKTTSRIYARKTSVRIIPNKEAHDFCDMHHMQGRGQIKIAYGLFYNDALVSVMTFAHINISKSSNKNVVHDKAIWELSRFCNQLNTSIIGGAGKLLKAFIRDHNPIKIISYADLRWSIGGLYEQLGFTLSHESRPNYWYIKKYSECKRYHRFQFRKNANDNQALTEWENRQLQGFDRIWDCGNQCWILTP